MKRFPLSSLNILKPFIKWLVLGVTIAFLGDHLRRYGTEMLALSLTPAAYGWIAVSLGVTIAAHCWAGVAWGWILRYLNYPQSSGWAMQIYLHTNIAKYLPGNIWHIIRRVQCSQTQHIPLSISILSVGLEAFLMMAAALILALGSPLPWGFRVLGVAAVLALLHPRVLNPILEHLERSKRQGLEHLEDLAVVPPVLSQAVNLQVDPQENSPKKTQVVLHYPWKLLGGELIFVALRSLGFLAIVVSLYPLPLGHLGSLVSGFSVAWVLGLVVPGAPGGLGVFETTAILLLDGFLPATIVLATVTIYRVVSTLAEAIGAGVVYIFARP